jgi:hypothetical protein
MKLVLFTLTIFAVSALTGCGSEKDTGGDTGGAADQTDTGGDTGSDTGA